MKKTIVVLFIVFTLLAMPGCGSRAVSGPSSGTGPAETAQPSETVLPALSAPAQAEAPASGMKTPGGVDVDLTGLSSTMVYAEVYAMVYEPERYIGKTVKMHGLFATQEYNGERLYACIVEDATACCAQGLEFEMAEGAVYPDDYPEPGAEITIVGTFDASKEEIDGNYYFYPVIRNARLA